MSSAPVTDTAPVNPAFSSPLTEILEDDGWVTITIREPLHPGQNPELAPFVTLTLDLYKVNNELLALPKENNNAELVQYIEKLGFPKCSQKTAIDFADKIWARVADLKKKAESTPKLPDSTTSTHSS